MLEFKYLSRKAVEALDPISEPHLFISVTSPGDPLEARLQTNEKTLGVLRLTFHEIYDEWLDARPGYSARLKEYEAEGTAFTRETGKRVIDFVRSHPEAKVIVVHCDAGLARSPGIVRALARTVYRGQRVTGVSEGA